MRSQNITIAWETSTACLRHREQCRRKKDDVYQCICEKWSRGDAECVDVASKHVSESQVLLVRHVKQALLHTYTGDLAVLALRLEPRKVVELGQTNARLLRLAPELVPTLVLADEQPAEGERADDDHEVRHERDPPGDEVPRAVLLFPELRAEDLPERVPDEEDRVGRHLLGVPRDGGGDPGHSHDEAGGAAHIWIIRVVSGWT